MKKKQLLLTMLLTTTTGIIRPFSKVIVPAAVGATAALLTEHRVEIRNWLKVNGKKGLTEIKAFIQAIETMETVEEHETPQPAIANEAAPKELSKATAPATEPDNLRQTIATETVATDSTTTSTPTTTPSEEATDLHKIATNDDSPKSTN